MTGPALTHMEAETREAPDVAARLIERASKPLAELGARLRASPPRFAITAGRGSSGAASLFAKYLFEQHLGIVTASATPSLSSIYGGTLDLRESLVVAISQSGQSPDLVGYCRAAGGQGALRVGMINVAGSNLEGAVDLALPLEAGPETSVAATKSCLAAMLLCFGLVAHWRNDREMIAAFEGSPDVLGRALALEWPGASDFMTGDAPLYTIGRGPGLAIAKEAALKLKETAGVFAQAYSSAEVLHGPFALAGPNLRVLIFAQRDAAREGLDKIAEAFEEAGSRAMLVAWPPNETQPAMELIGLLTRFYLLANATTLQRGRSPDQPPRLRKVTETR